MTARKPGRPAKKWLRVRCPACGHLFGFRYKLTWVFRDKVHPQPSAKEAEA
jgi:hypothetical protein